MNADVFSVAEYEQKDCSYSSSIKADDMVITANLSFGNYKVCDMFYIVSSWLFVYYSWQV
jgi:hypothetical protein